MRYTNPLYLTFIFGLLTLNRWSFHLLAPLATYVSICSMAHLFSKYRIHGIGKERMNERTDAQVENIMPPRSLDWWLVEAWKETDEQEKSKSSLAVGESSP